MKNFFPKFLENHIGKCDFCKACYHNLIEHFHQHQEHFDHPLGEFPLMKDVNRIIKNCFHCKRILTSFSIAVFTHWLTGIWKSLVNK